MMAATQLSMDVTIDGRLSMDATQLSMDVTVDVTVDVTADVTVDVTVTSVVDGRDLAAHARVVLQQVRNLLYRDTSPIRKRAPPSQPVVQGHLAHKKSPTPWDPRHRPSVGS